MSKKNKQQNKPAPQDPDTIPIDTPVEEEEVAEVKTPATPVCGTEMELRTHPQPEKQKGYRMVLNGETGYTWAPNPDQALLRLAKKQGGKANSLGKKLNPDQVYNEVMSLPPEHLQALVAKINASAHVAGKEPTA